MAASTSLNAKNLEALGAARLAELLMEVAAGNAAVKRQLRLALAGAEGPRSVAKEITKRLAAIGRGSKFLDWRETGPFARDLDAQRRAITEQIAPNDPALALDLAWRFMDLADAVFARADDSNGALGDIFRAACRDLGLIATAARPDPEVLAARVFRALTANDYGQFDGLIGVVAPALGAEGLNALKRLVVELSNTPVVRPAERKVIGYGFGRGNIYEDDVKETSRKHTVEIALRDIADAQGDVDAFIAQYDAKARTVPKIAAEIATRLLAAGRAGEALKALDASEKRNPNWPGYEWEDARIAVLDALGRGDQAQEMRWSCFERFLSAAHLRAYLKRLKDFDDVEAEERALDHALNFESLYQAMTFLLQWPATERLAVLITRRAGELDGNAYEILSPVADALAGKFPLAASLALRAMIDFTLRHARATRYGHAARHLKDCESLAAGIADFGAFETHDAYQRRLRAAHGKKTAFWSLAGMD